MLLQLDRAKEALEILQGLKNKMKDNAQVNFYTALALERLGRNSEAAAIYSSIPLDSETGVDAVIRLSKLLFKEGKIDKAVSVLEKAISRNPHRADLYTSLASLYEKNGNPKKAIEALKRGIAKNPKNKALTMSLVMLLDNLGEKQAAVKYAREILKVDPDYVPALNYIGYTFAEQGIHLEEAEKLLKRAVKLVPKDGFVLDSLGWLYFRKKEFNKAYSYLKKARSLVPQDPIISEHMGDLYLARQEFKKAAREYSFALKKAKKKADRRRIRKKLHRAREAVSDMPDY